VFKCATSAADEDAGRKMSDVFVARQPIFDPSLDVTAYELLFRGSNAIDRAIISDHDEATATVVVNAFTELGIETVVGQNRAWVNVGRDFVVGGMAFALPADRVVLELLEDQVVDDELITAIELMRRDGYSFALDDFIWSDDRVPLLSLVDVVKVEVLGRDFGDVVSDVERLAPYGVRLLAEKVETREEYEACAALGFELFQGYFFCKPQTLAARGVAPNRLAMLQLLAALNDPNVDFAQLETLISRDVALSYRLLRYINSAFFGLRREVDSIGRALALLGLENVKRWSTLTVFAGIEDKPRELIVTALSRARFCELAGPRLLDGARPDRLFTLGLFSVIDALMDAPMADLLATIPFPAEMSDALISRSGPHGALLATALDCERGRFPSDELAGLHMQALAWASEAADQLFERPRAAA
jgi:EAL and modified HD-GYP domain-containing signal transduction protein